MTEKGKWTRARLRALRARRRWTQPQLAAVLDVTPTTVARWEAEMKAPSRMAVNVLNAVEAQLDREDALRAAAVQTRKGESE